MTNYIVQCFQPPNNLVRYTITEDQEDLDCFLINEVTGQLLLRRSLLYDPCRANAFVVSIDVEKTLFL